MRIRFTSVKRRPGQFRSCGLLSRLGEIVVIPLLAFGPEQLELFMRPGPVGASLRTYALARASVSTGLDLVERHFALVP